MTAFVTLVVAAYVAMRDWRAAMAFSIASAWGMANLVVWSAGCREILMGGEHRGTKLLRLGLIKVALLVTGLLLLRYSFPLSANEAIAVITGVPMVLVVMVLKAVGARATGRDLMTGKNATRNSAEAAAMAGGQA
jgi:hypothetical protein